MSDKFSSWKEVIVDFFDTKKEADKEKYLKGELKKISKLYENEGYYSEQELQDFFDAKKNKKAEGQSALDFQQKKLEKVFEFPNQPSEFNKRNTADDYKNKCDDIDKKYSPHEWFTNNSKNASNISFATHVAKLTHSKIDTPSFYDCISDKKDSQLSTSALKNKAVDGAVAGNQFAPIFQFLELELNGAKLAEEFNNESNTVLEPFAQKDEDLLHWNQKFKQSLTSGQLSSHTLAKQIYFPINNDESVAYHLLCNVKSSSIAHKIYENVFNKNEEKAKKLRSKDSYSDTLINLFLKKAKISVTASNHNNASQLNGKRGGKIYLFSNQPPTWQSQLKPPLQKTSMFNGYYSSPNTKKNINYLHDFLMRFKNLDLSIKDPQRKKHLDRWVNDIIDDWLFYVGNIQNLPAGWSSSTSKLKEEHQFLLDPYRPEVEFQEKLKNNAWQAVVASDFANWLNRQLKAKNKQFTPQAGHRKIWIKLVEQSLREYSENVAFDVLSKEEVKV